MLQFSSGREKSPLFPYYFDPRNYDSHEYVVEAVLYIVGSEKYLRQRPIWSPIPTLFEPPPLPKFQLAIL